MRLLIANRSEIAVRIAQTAQRMGMETLGVCASDEGLAHHSPYMDRVAELPGSGPTAYLDIKALIQIAQQEGATLIHPGYGFLSEHPDAARLAVDAGLKWVGPDPKVIALMGQKPAAIALAKELGIPTVPGLFDTRDRQSLEALLRRAKEDYGPNASLLLKAQSGGGGRGIRAVDQSTKMSSVIEQASREANANFGQSSLYAEVEIPDVRHIEVQFVGDGTRVWILGDRDCSIQRRRQKFIEIGPAPSIGKETRQALHQAAAKLALKTNYRGLGTAEFVLRDDSWWFIEVNARLQVEHTVTEATTGLDLVALQLILAKTHDMASSQEIQNLLQAFPSLDHLAGELNPGLAPFHSIAIQCRVMAESYEHSDIINRKKWIIRPSRGTISEWKPPRGAGIRVDTAIEAGCIVTANYDTLLAKLVVSMPAPAFEEDWGNLLSKLRTAIAEFQIQGIRTNIDWLGYVVDHLRLNQNNSSTWQDLKTHWFDRWIESFLGNQTVCPSNIDTEHAVNQQHLLPNIKLDVEQIDHIRGALVDIPPDRARAVHQSSTGSIKILSPIDGVVLELISVGTSMAKGAELGIIESMKMHHAIEADRSMRVRRWTVHTGEQVIAGQEIGEAIEHGEELTALQSEGLSHLTVNSDRAVGSGQEHPRVVEWRLRERLTRDESRHAAVSKRRATGMRTVRENLADLLDAGSFIELGSLVVAAQRRRRSLDDLIHHTPADGVITGFGKVSHARFPSAAKVAVIAYDYTVLAGTQGKLNHDKQDRLLDICYKTRTPLLLLAEGGGGRPGDVDVVTAGSLHIKTFSKFAMLSGLVPVIGIIAGRCFAGNAVLLGCCDVIIATKNSNIGMAGPAMIEGGGLGRFAADDIGPSPVQEANGVIDIIAEDESQAIALAKRYLGYFQGNESAWQYASQSKLADSLPRDRLRVYDMRLLIEHLIDDDSGLELRSKFAPNIITMLARIEGKPIGLIANNPGRLGGAIDANAADKAARFVQLCNAHGLPIISLIDTPGNMVGPQAEAQALVRHCCRLFVAGAKVTVPWVSIVIRKAYGLGAMAMAAGSFHDSLLSVAWPQAEFGGMGLEGAVRLGFKRELESLSSDQEREALFQSKFDEMMEQGKAISAAMLFEIDAVIDPDATREWILGALEVAGAFEPHGFLEPASSLKMAGSYTKGSASRTMASNGLSARFIDTW